MNIEQNTNPQPSTTPATPGGPDEGQTAQPNIPDTEVNPGKVGNGTEVDLDRGKTQTYPKTNPPERH